MPLEPPPPPPPEPEPPASAPVHCGISVTCAAGPAPRLWGGGDWPGLDEPEFRCEEMILTGQHRWVLGHGHPSRVRGRAFGVRPNRSPASARRWPPRGALAGGSEAASKAGGHM